MKDVTAPGETNNKSQSRVSLACIFRCHLPSVDFSCSDFPFSLFLPSPPVLWLMKGFICHPAGDECSVFHPDL